LSRSGNRPLRIVIVAEEAAGVQTLRSLLALPQPPDVVAVLTTPPEHATRRPLVFEAACGLGLETWPADVVRRPELADRLRGADVDLLLNVHSLYLVDPAVLAAPRIGSFNLHPGPLPEYAGLNVPSWAIYRGEGAHAVTVHWMDSGIDTGPIAYTASFEVSDSDTGLSLASKCIRHGIPLIMQLVRDAASEVARIPRIDQDLGRRRYFGNEAPNGGRIDWARPAAEIARFVRGADYAPFPSPWGHPTAELFGRTVGIAKAALTGRAAPGPPGAVYEVTEAGALVAAADELLLVERLWEDGGYVKPLDAAGHGSLAP
jgi:methionyl-tRNA formyltransferase